jgi:hypothetical protein
VLSLQGSATNSLKDILINPDICYQARLLYWTLLQKKSGQQNFAAAFGQIEKQASVLFANACSRTPPELYSFDSIDMVSPKARSIFLTLMHVEIKAF